MRLKVLEDNNTFIDKYYLGEPAVSYYIEDGDIKILFDTGYSDAFIKNAKSMGINLKEINKVVISHGHNDHTGGLKYLFDINEKLNKTIQYFKEIKPELLYPCHCVSLDAKIEIGKKLKINEVGVGLEINIDSYYEKIK